MSWIKGVSDYALPDFTALTDEQMLKMNLNVQLNSVDELEAFKKELEKRNLVEKRREYQNKSYMHEA
ncbi:hypothetical protein MXZ33_07280 [Streptococcus uberis]|nr:hypothetical protein [Streptococcus uberis]MCK1200565.1 hypothetical protein [Streptococcus uberis]